MKDKPRQVYAKSAYAKRGMNILDVPLLDAVCIVHTPSEISYGRVWAHLSCLSREALA